MAKDNGRVLVDELATHFNVTPQTIRKDLNDLCEQRLLSRVHGGALFPSGIENMEYEARRKIAADEKDAIGRAAARLIPDNASLFINIGTTTEAVSTALLDHDGLMVITNNINVANRMRVYPSIEVVIAGGVVRGSDGGMYVMLDISAVEPDDEKFAWALLDAEKVAVMPGSSFGEAAAGHIRISLCQPEDVLLDAASRLRRFVSTYRSKAA